MEMPGGAEPLSGQEVEALISAAAWYAKYHAGIIAERADDHSAYALAQRERYQELLGALRKLGVRLRDPLTAGSAETQVEREAA